MRYVMLVGLIAVGCGDSAKDRGIAELRKKVAEQAQAKSQSSPVDLAPPPAVPRVTEVTGDPRGPLLLRLCHQVEENGGATLYNLGIKDEDVFDDDGHVKAPSGFCTLLREKVIKRSGKDGSQAVLVNTYGSELGTQVWNGSLCADPPVVLGREAPTREELVRRLGAHIKRDVGGWARQVHQKVSDILDDKGELRDAGSLAASIRTSAQKRYGKKARHVLMQSGNFGAELGAAIFSGRLEAARE